MRLVASSLALALVGCNQYEMFSLAGYEQLSFSNDADVLFIMDNSLSMQGEAQSVGLNFNTFVSSIADPSGGNPETETLSDAVTNYMSFISERGAVMDFQLGLTTTSVDDAAGPTAALDPGEAGTLVGGVISNDQVDIPEAFRQQLLCDSTCWSVGGEESPVSDPDYTCGQVPDKISEEYLNCTCGVGGWSSDTCGAGTEEHLEALALALCRAVDNPPDACFETRVMTEADIGSNAGLLREGATTVAVFITDEGDTSRQLISGHEDPSLYLDLYDQLGLRLKIAAIGQPYDGGALVCNSGNATAWGIERLQLAAAATGGFYNPIVEQTSSGDCQMSDFSKHLQDLGELLKNLLTSFQLRSVPDQSTIHAFIDGKEVPEASLTDGVEGQPGAIYDNGWSYDPSENAVLFWGDAIPDYNQKVQIFYRPLDGTPRELPF